MFKLFTRSICNISIESLRQTWCVVPAHTQAWLLRNWPHLLSAWEQPPLWEEAKEPHPRATRRWSSWQPQPRSKSTASVHGQTWVRDPGCCLWVPGGELPQLAVPSQPYPNPPSPGPEWRLPSSAPENKVELSMGNKQQRKKSPLWSHSTPKPSIAISVMGGWGSLQLFPFYSLSEHKSKVSPPSLMHSDQWNVIRIYMLIVGRSFNVCDPPNPTSSVTLRKTPRKCISELQILPFGEGGYAVPMMDIQ